MHYVVAPDWRTLIFPGAAMSYAHVELLRFLAACFGIGAAIGLIRGIVVMPRQP